MSCGQGEKINAEGYLCSMERRQIRAEIPIKSIIYFNGNNKIRDGPKRNFWDVPCGAISILWWWAWICTSKNPAGTHLGEVAAFKGHHKWERESGGKGNLKIK